MNKKILLLILFLNQLSIFSVENSENLSSFSDAVYKVDLKAVIDCAKTDIDICKLNNGQNTLDYLQQRYDHYDRRASHFRHLNKRKMKKNKKNRNECGQVILALINCATDKLKIAIENYDKIEVLHSLSSFAKVTPDLLEIETTEEIEEILKKTLNLFLAVQEHNLDNINSLLQENNKIVNATDGDGKTVLFYALTARNSIKKDLKKNNKSKWLNYSGYAASSLSSRRNSSYNAGLMISTSLRDYSIQVDKKDLKSQKADINQVIDLLLKYGAKSYFK